MECGHSMLLVWLSRHRVIRHRRCRDRPDLGLRPCRGCGAVGLSRVRAPSPGGDRRLLTPAGGVAVACAGTGPRASAEGVRRACFVSDLRTRQGDDEGAFDRWGIDVVDTRVNQGEHLQRGPATSDLREAGGDGRMARTTMRPLGRQPRPRGVSVGLMQVPTPQAGCATGDDKGADHGLRSEGRDRDVRHVQSHGLGVGCGVWVRCITEHLAGSLERCAPMTAR